MDIDPRYLANLLSIAKHGSFNRAAAARGISQPALSNSIAQLERRLGVQVLDRSRRGSALNEFGKILVRNAEVVDAVLLRTVDEVRLRKVGVSGPLRIGAVPSLTAKFLPQLMSALLKENQSISVTVVEGLDDQLLPSLLVGDLDLVMGPLAGIFPAATDIIEDVLFDDPFSVGVGPHHPLQDRRTLTLSELTDYAWILPLPGNSYRRHIEALFMTEGVAWPTNCVHTSSLALAESLLASTDRITMITELQSRMQNQWSIRSVPLKGGGKRSIGIKWRRTGALSPLAASFVQMAHKIAAAANQVAGAAEPRPKRPAKTVQRKR